MKILGLLRAAPRQLQLDSRPPQAPWRATPNHERRTRDGPSWRDESLPPRRGGTAGCRTETKRLLVMPKAPASGSRPVRELGRRSLALPLPGHAASRLGRDLASAPCAWPQSSAPGRCRKATAVGQIVRCNGTAADGRVKYLGVVQLVDPLLTSSSPKRRRGAAESSHSTFDMSSVPERAPAPLNRGGVRALPQLPQKGEEQAGHKE